MDSPLVPLSYKEEMYGRLFSRNTLRYLYHIPGADPGFGIRGGGGAGRGGGGISLKG
jgi:hypothetical protein